MFKNRMIQVKLVDVPQTEPTAPTCVLTDFAAADIARERSERMLRTAAGAFVLYKSVDTLNQIALHIVKTKIK